MRFEPAASEVKGKCANHLATEAPYTRYLEDGTEKKQTDEIVHVKGFTLKGDAKHLLTFDSINECIKDKKKEIEITYREFVREPSQSIAVKKTTKKFKFTFDKRVVHTDFTTTPFGYK